MCGLGGPPWESPGAGAALPSPLPAGACPVSTAVGGGVAPAVCGLSQGHRSYVPAGSAGTDLCRGLVVDPRGPRGEGAHGGLDLWLVD